MSGTVLIVDDSQTVRMSLVDLLEGAEFATRACATLAEARAALAAERFALVLLDVLLPDGNGADVASALAALPHPPGVVLTSSYPQGGFGAQLSTLPVLGFVPKEQLSVGRLAELFG